MKNFLKVFFLVAITCSFGIIQKVSADEIEVQTITYGDCEEMDKYETIGVSEYKPFNALSSNTLLRGTSVPSSNWNLATQGSASLSAETAYTNLYSNYNYTGVSTINVWVTSSKWYNFTMELYKNNLLSDTKVATYNVTAGVVTQFITTGLDSSKKYYLKIYAPAYFSGYVSA